MYHRGIHFLAASLYHRERNEPGIKKTDSVVLLSGVTHAVTDIFLPFKHLFASSENSCCNSSLSKALRRLKGKFLFITNKRKAHFCTFIFKPLYILSRKASFSTKGLLFFVSLQVLVQKDKE